MLNPDIKRDTHYIVKWSGASTCETPVIIFMKKKVPGVLLKFKKLYWLVSLVLVLEIKRNSLLFLFLGICLLHILIF